jgi:hypothetical protein
MSLRCWESELPCSASSGCAKPDFWPNVVANGRLRAAVSFVEFSFANIGGESVRYRVGCPIFRRQTLQRPSVSRGSSAVSICI